MLRSNSFRWVRNIALLLVGTAAIFVSVLYARQLIAMDPFALHRELRTPLGQNVVMRMEDVKLWHFADGKAITTADVDRMDVHESRQEISLYDIRNGAYRGDKGSFKYEAQTARWNAVARRLDVTGKVTIRNANMNLLTSGFSYDQNAQVLSAPTKVQGTFHKGDLQAEGLLYNLKEEEAKVGPMSWHGKLALFQEAGDTRRRPWSIKTGQNQTNFKNDVMTAINGEATDGEVIIKAPKIEWNRKTDVLVAYGPVRYYSAEANLVCNKATVYRKERRALLAGAVDMLFKPEDQRKLEVVEIPPFQPVVPESIAKSRPPAPVGPDKDLDRQVRETESLRRYPVAVTAAQVEYWYGRGQRRAVITGSPQARQDLPGGRWRYAWAARALYDGEKETLRMLSTEGKKDTRVKTSVGDDIIATWFEISTKENEDEWSANGLEGDIYPDEDEVPERPGRTTNPPPPLSGPIGRSRRL